MFAKITDIQLFSNLTVGGLIILIGTLFTFLKKNKVVTTLTSAKIEQILFTKEKKLYVEIMKYILQLVMSTLLCCTVMGLYYEMNMRMSIVFSIIWVAALTYIILIYVTYTKKDFLDKLMSVSNKTLVLLFILFIHVVCLFSIIPSALSAILQENQLKINYAEPEQFLGMLLAVFVAIGLTNVFIVLLARQTISHFFRKFSKYSGESFYVKFQDNKNWYIYYPIDKDYFLLGDSTSIEEATVFRTEERTKILNQKIYLLKLLKNKDKSIEYHI